MPTLVQDSAAAYGVANCVIAVSPAGHAILLSNTDRHELPLFIEEFVSHSSRGVSFARVSSYAVSARVYHIRYGTARRERAFQFLQQTELLTVQPCEFL